MRKSKVALLICAMTGMILVGCGNGHNVAADKYTTIGTVGGQEISYSLANFAARYEQATYEKNNLEVMGKDLWTTPMAEGKTLEESKKAEVLEGLERMVYLASKAEGFKVVLTTEEEANIKKAAEKFMKDNSDKVLDKMTATQEVVEEYLRYYTLSVKVFDRIANEEKDSKLSQQHARDTVERLMSEAEIDIDQEAWANITFDGHFDLVTNN